MTELFLVPRVCVCDLSKSTVKYFTTAFSASNVLIIVTITITIIIIIIIIIIMLMDICYYEC